MTLVNVVVVTPATAATLRANVLTERGRFIFHHFTQNYFFAILIPGGAADVTHAGEQFASFKLALVNRVC